MAYITTSNAKSIIHKTEINSLDLRGSVYKTPIHFLNRLEVNRMLVIKELFSDSERFFTEYYKPIKTRDTLTYVYEGKKPAYHNKISCVRLNSDYENFEIPELIKDGGITEIEKFRKWFKENKYLMEKPDVFVARLQLKWGLTTNPQNIIKPNSEASQFDDLNAIDIEEKIDNLLNIAKELVHANPEVLTKYSKLSYLGKSNKPLVDNDTKIPDHKVKEILQEFESKVKTPLNPLLIAYYRLTLNPDLNLHDNVLKQLGFVRCGYCFKESESSYESIEKTETSIISENIMATFKLIQQGNNISFIAKKRTCTIETIIKHAMKIAEVVGTKELISIKPTDEVINKVKNALSIVNSREKLSPIYKLLGEQIDYNEIRLSLIFIE